MKPKDPNIGFSDPSAESDSGTVVGSHAPTLVMPRRPAPTTIIETEEAGGQSIGYELRIGGLFEGYRILAPLEVSSGEADLWLLKQPSSRMKFVLKYYRYGVRPKREILDRLSQLRANHIVRLITYGQVNDRHYEIQEFLPGGTLADRIREGPIRQEMIREILTQLADGLSALQAFSVLHRDVKPSNLMFRNREPVELIVTDFGISSVADISLHLTTVNRTPAYCAPEAMAGVVSKASDWWSVGVIVLEMLLGRHPFAGMSEQAVNFQLISKGIEIPQSIAPDWKFLLSGLLTRNYRQRWGANEVERWLEGDRSMELPHDSSEVGAPNQVRSYRFDGAEYGTVEELAEALARNWPEALRHWNFGYVLRWVEMEAKRQDLGVLLREVQADVKLSPDQRLSIALLILHPDLPLAVQGIVIEASYLESNPELAYVLAHSGLGRWLVRCRSDRWLEQWSLDYLEAEREIQSRLNLELQYAKTLLCVPLEALNKEARQRISRAAGSKVKRIEQLIHQPDWNRAECIELITADPRSFLTSAEARIEQVFREIVGCGWHIDGELARGLIEDSEGALLETHWRKLKEHWEERSRTPIKLSHELMIEVLGRPLERSVPFMAVVANRLDYVNSLGLRMIPISGTRTFWSCWQVRVVDFDRFRAETGEVVKPPFFAQSSEHPVVNVSARQAGQFCDWLTSKERNLGLIGLRDRYRLPSDREWSRIVGLGFEPGNSPRERNGAIGGVFPWGSVWPPRRGIANLSQDLGVDDYQFTAPVGSFPANDLGLFDVGSNVSEWCSDDYDEDILLKVIRGASWSSASPESCLSSARRRMNEITSSDNVGFRIVLEYRVPPPSTLADGMQVGGSRGNENPVYHGVVGTNPLPGDQKSKGDSNDTSATAFRKKFWKLFSNGPKSE